MRLSIRFTWVLFVSLSLVMCAHVPLAPNLKDDHMWLEEIDSPKALDWVRSHNQSSLGQLEANPQFSKFKQEAEKILMAKDRIPSGQLRGGYVYNFWQDEKNVHGLWRRAKLKEYMKAAPRWEVLLDLDQLSKDENENWVYKGASCLPPVFERCLLTLSRGGKDASVGREFNVTTKQFVPGGFEIPEAKFSADWVDENTLFVGTDWGPGSLTKSGYPRIIKRWSRGTPLAKAEFVYEVEEDNISAGSYVIHQPEKNYAFLSRQMTFWTSENFIYLENGQKIKIPVQDDASFLGFLNRQLVFQLRSTWTVGLGATQKSFPQGALVSLSYDEVVQGKNDFTVHLILAPTEKTAIDATATSRDSLYVTLLDNVKGRLLRFQFARGRWGSQIVRLPQTGTLYLISSDTYTEEILVSYQNFLETSRLFYVKGSSFGLLKSQPDRFDARGLKVSQFFATSRDGTKIPYFLVAKNNLVLNGKNPTLVYGYGGFEYALTPWYLSATGKLWSERGGVYVVANIRGGGEFGPAWHQAALGKNRQKAFDDFIAVNEDLIKRKITSPQHLGIMGGSNGGLLVGATFVQRPELFGAVVCQVPLLDMLRFHKLLAGASWIGEYGDPEKVDEREYLLTYSPYQNLKANTKYPKVFFLTSTKDDRVHPGHARKMVARMEAMGNSVYYYENIDGGHSAAANLKERARQAALEFVYLSDQLGLAK